jgi:hypothetical protein
MKVRILGVRHYQQIPHTVYIYRLYTLYNVLLMLVRYLVLSYIFTN